MSWECTEVCCDRNYTLFWTWNLLQTPSCQFPLLILFSAPACISGRYRIDSITMCFEKNWEACKQIKWHLISTSLLLTSKLNSIPWLDNDTGKVQSAKKDVKKEKKQQPNFIQFWHQLELLLCWAGEEYFKWMWGTTGEQLRSCIMKKSSLKIELIIKTWVKSHDVKKFFPYKCYRL